MSWVKDSLWIPEGEDQRNIDQPTHILVAARREWPQAREHVACLGGYLKRVILITPNSMEYLGVRFESVSMWGVDPSEYAPEWKVNLYAYPRVGDPGA